jgi:hypothetical protein
LLQSVSSTIRQQVLVASFNCAEYASALSPTDLLLLVRLDLTLTVDRWLLELFGK